MQIQSTQDYDLFKSIKGNRKPNRSHISKLKEAIGANPNSIKYTPILVNEDWQIIDGQHRKIANQELGLPIYYIQEKGLGLSDVQGLNSLSKTWTPDNYAHSYADIGKKAYQTYIDFKAKYHLNHDILLSFLGLDEPITPHIFKVGKMKITDENKSHDLCRKLLELGEFYPKYYRRAFAFAFKQMWSTKKYDHKHMVSKMMVKGSSLEDFSVPEDYLRALERIYNNHTKRGEDRIRFF